MYKRCKICREKPKLERQVNSEGIVFCSDDCYEQWEHPADDYGYPSPRYLIEELDDVVHEYYEYELLEGRDGVYSEEIYAYLWKFDELREIIRVWTIEEHKYRRVFKTMERERNERWRRVREEREG